MASFDLTMGGAGRPHLSGPSVVASPISSLELIDRWQDECRTPRRVQPSGGDGEAGGGAVPPCSNTGGIDPVGEGGASSPVSSSVGSDLYRSLIAVSLGGVAGGVGFGAVYGESNEEPDIRHYLARASANPGAAMVDWLNFTFRASTTYRDCLSDDDIIIRLSNDLHEVLGYGVTSKADNGKMFYRESYILGNGWGFVAIGGQRDTVLVCLTGTACMAAREGWEKRLYDLLNNNDIGKGPVFDRVRITRVDLALDLFHGEYTVDKALEDYKAGLYSLGARMPEVEQRGNWINPGNAGRSLYIGSRISGKLLRDYEKGKQLGGDFCKLFPDWVRVELELHNKDRDIPLDVLLRPGQYLAGSYPALEWIDSQNQERIATFKKTGQIAYERAIEVAKNQIGKLINCMELIEGSAEAVIAKLIRPGVPKRILDSIAHYADSLPQLAIPAVQDLDVAFHIASG